MSKVEVNELAIRRFFRQRQPRQLRALGERLAAQMVVEARRNASGEVVRRRSGTLAASVVPIVRQDRATGSLEVGVGSTAPYSDYLESGTLGPYPIVPRDPFGFLASRADNPDPLRHPQRHVNHPGISPKRWLQQAVESVVRRWLG